MYNLGNAYRRSGDQEMAIRNYEACKRIADSLDIPSLSAKSCKALSVSYEAFRNFDKAAELEEELAAMKQPSVSIEIPVSENEMDLEHEKTQEILSKLNEEALKRKDLVEAGADKKMTDMYINNLNGRFIKEQSKTRILLIVAGSLGVLLIVTFILSRRKKKK
jgi:tetratricopeptide (TPR) repeat protein